MKPISRYEMGTEIFVIAIQEMSRSPPSDLDKGSFSQGENIHSQTGEAILPKLH